MTAPDIALDTSSAVPVYEQIRAQIAGYVVSGALAAGDRLPTVRALAADLGVAVNTVAHAYRELEAAGVVVTRRRAGTVVADDAAPPEAGVARRADDFARAAVASDLDDSAALALVRAALRAARLA